MLRVMIVDDEQIIREALSDIIDYDSLGYELIATARNGMEAYDKICDEYPDVVITDICMPILNGLELIDRALKTDSNITFILLSGYSEFEYAKQAMKYGVRYYLLKPTNRNELVEVLNTIQGERMEIERKEKKEQQKLLQKLRAPLEQSFILDALEHQENFSSIFHKYKNLLYIPSTCINACICSYVEEKYIQKFVYDINGILLRNNITLLFPVIYVRNSAIMIFPAPSLAIQELIISSFNDLIYENQFVSFETFFLHAETSQDLFHKILLNISRYERILLYHSNESYYEIKNNLASPWHISRIVNELLSSNNQNQIKEMIDSIFSDALPIETARNMALGIFVKLISNYENETLDITCDFFRKLYSCTSINEISSLLQVVILQRNNVNINKSSNNISILKSYVEKHLDSENLSLKWLAENYLFVSVGYLSKLFMKEEGIRFSDYLNKKRMEEAVKLMVYYHNDNIKQIAKLVGFSNNPQYFSQVFKRYNGQTPSDFIEKLRST